MDPKETEGSRRTRKSRVFPNEEQVENILERIAESEDVEEAVKESLEGLTKERKAEFVSVMWEWIKGAGVDAGATKLAIAAANILSKAIITPAMGKDGPARLPIKDSEDGIKKMLGEHAPEKVN